MSSLQKEPSSTSKSSSRRPATLARRLIIPQQIQSQGNVTGPKGGILPRRSTNLLLNPQRPSSRSIVLSKYQSHKRKSIQSGKGLSTVNSRHFPSINLSTTSDKFAYKLHDKLHDNLHDNLHDKPETSTKDKGYVYCLVKNFYTLIPTTREIATSFKKSNVIACKSKDGVLRIFKDSRRSKEFTEIQRWHQEVMAYGILQKYDFFKQGLKRRIFQNWAYIVRRTKFERAGQQVSNKWFALHSALSVTLYQVWALRLQFLRATHATFFAFESLREVMSVAKPGQSSLQLLYHHLMDSKASGVTAVQSFITDTQSLVCDTLLHVLAVGLGEQRIFRDQHKAKESTLPKYDLPRRIINEFRRFIRLIDCIAASTLVFGCIEKQHVMNMLLHKGKHSVDRQETVGREYLIQIRVHTNLERRFVGCEKIDNSLSTSKSNNIRLEPSLKLINELLSNIEKHYLDCVVHVKRLRGKIDLEKTLRNVKAYAKTGGIENIQLKMSDIIMTRETIEFNNEGLVRPVSVEKHPDWIAWRQKNRTAIESDFHKILETSESIVEKLLSFGNHHENRRLPSVLELQQKIRSGLTPVDDISSVVERLQTHRKELQRVETTIYMGPLATSLKFVQESEMKRTQKDLKELSKSLPLLLERLCLGVRDEIDSLQNRIDQDAETLEGASAMVLISLNISLRIDKLREGEQDARHLNRLLVDLHLNPSKETAAYLPTLNTSLDQLQASNYGLMSRKEDTIARWRMYINERLGELYDETHALRKQLVGSIGSDIEPQDALADLETTLFNAEKSCKDASLLLKAEKIFSEASPEDPKNLLHLHHSKRKTLLQETENCCSLLDSTQNIVQMIVNLNALTLSLRKQVRISAELPVVASVDGGNNEDDLSLLKTTCQQLSEVATTLLDQLGTKASDLCKSRLSEARDSESVVETIYKLRRCVRGHLSVDHRDEIVAILHPDNRAFRPAVAAAANLKGLGWIRVKDVYNITIEARESIAFIIHVSESQAALRVKFTRLKRDWKDMTLTFGTWNGKMTTLELTETFAQYLENTDVEVSALMSNPYSTNIKNEIEDFAEETSIVQETTTDWIQMQLTLQQLIQVFDSASVKLQLKKEFQILRRATLDWEELFEVTFDQPALEMLASSKFQNHFRHISVALDTISHGVQKYLELRRLSFPRFFFLHDEELISVLEHTLKMHEFFETHVHRCFPGIRAGTFDRSDRSKPVLIEVQSTSNEIIALGKPISEGIDFLPSLARQVSAALRATFCEMKQSLRVGGGNMDIRSIEAIKKDVPVHILSALIQCDWYATVNSNMRSLNGTESNNGNAASLAIFLKAWTERNLKLSTKLTMELRNSPVMDVYGAEEQSRHRDRKNKIARGEAILMHDLCARDRAKILIDRKVESVDHSEWSLCSKMSLTRGEGMSLNIGNVRIDYGFECIGIDGMGASQLVLSHTVMRCMWAIANATQMLNCCALVYPSSLGCLDLIQGMAAVCAIFSPEVSFSIDSHHRHIVRVIKGASSCSCWLRLSNLCNLDILSSAVLASSISSLILAVQRGLTKATFAGVEIPVLLKTTLVGFECIGCDFNERFPTSLSPLFHATGIIAADTLRIAELLLVSKGVKQSAKLVNDIVGAVKCLTNQMWNNDSAFLSASQSRSKMRTCEAVVSSDTDDEFRKSAVLGIINSAIAKVHTSSERKSDIEHDISIVIQSMISVSVKNTYSTTLCTPEERFVIRKCLKSEKLGHLLHAEKGVVELHCSLNLWGIVALVGSHGCGKTSIRRVLLQARDDIRAGVGSRGRKRLRRRGAARTRGNRASVSLPKGRRSSLISPKRIDMTGSTHYIFPETLSFGEIFGTTNKEGWVEGVVGHLIKTMNNDRSRQNIMQKNDSSINQIPQYLIVDGCHRSPVIDMLINMSKNKRLDLPNGETLSTRTLSLRVIFELSSLYWLSPSHVASMGIVSLKSALDLPVVFFNLCQRISEKSLTTTFQQKILVAIQNLCVDITEVDVIGCTDHSTKLMPCAMAASRMIESIVFVCYEQGAESFSSDLTPDVDIIAKAVLCYAFLWARNAYVEDLPAEPTVGLLPSWLDDVSADLPLAVRHMEPKLMLAKSGYLLIENEVETIPPILESNGLISFSHLPGAQGGPYLLSVMAKAGMHVALAGPSRVGKTAIAQATTNSISNLERSAYKTRYIFNCQHNRFNPHSIGSAISECFSTTYGNVYSGIGGKRHVIIVIDDVAAQPDSIGDAAGHDRASSFELNGIRSLVCEKGYHDISTLLWQRVSLFNIVVTSQCRPNSSFAVQNHHFCTVQLNSLSSMSIQEMYCHVLHSRVSPVDSGGVGGGGALPTSVTNLIEPLVKATISTTAIYKMTREAAEIPPVQLDPMFLQLFSSPLKGITSKVEVDLVDSGAPTEDKPTNISQSREELDQANLEKVKKIRKWFHHARAVFADQCYTASAAKDLSDTLMSNLHAALGVHGEAIETKNRRVSVVNSDISSYSNSDAVSISDIFSAKENADSSPTETFIPSFPKNSQEFAKAFIAAGSNEHIELFQAILNILKTSQPHVAVVSDDIMLGTGIVTIAMSQVIQSEENMVLLRVGPMTKKSQENKVAARDVLFRVLSNAADIIQNGKDEKVGLVVENVDDLPLSMSSLLTAIATNTYPGGYFTANEKKKLIQKVQTGIADTGSDSCWAQIFSRITSKIILAIVVKDVLKLSKKYKVCHGCSVLGLIKLSKKSKHKVIVATMQKYKGIDLCHEVQNKIGNLFVFLEQKMDELGIVRSECMLLESILNFLEKLTEHNTEVRSKIRKYEAALRFQAIARERSALLNAEVVALNWRMILVNRKVTHLAGEVNKTQQSYGAKSRTLFRADKDATAVKSTVSKLTQEIDKNLLKSNNALAQARTSMRDVDHADIMRLLKEEDLPRVVFRLGTAASLMLGDDIIENDEEELRDFLANPLLLARIVRFDPQRGPTKSMLMTARQTQSQPYSKDQVQKFGSAALSMREWVHATASKICVLSDINPLYIQLDNAKLALTARNEALNAAFTDKQICFDQLQKWQIAYDLAVEERNRLQTKIVLRNEKMKTARDCARAVIPKVETWKKELEQHRLALETMIGDMWIGAACLRYVALVLPGMRARLLKSLKHFVIQQSFTLSREANFGCPSPSERAEINATMLYQELHPGIYMLDKINLPNVAVLVDPDSIARDFLMSTMKHDNGLELSFDGDLKFALTLQRAQLNRSTLLVEHLSSVGSSSAVWDTVKDSKQLSEYKEFYPGFQLILSCSEIPSWIKYSGMTQFVVIDFSRPTLPENYHKKGQEGRDVYLKVVDQLTTDYMKKNRQLLLVNIAQDLSDYDDAVEKLLLLVGGDFEKLIVNKETRRRINEAALSVELLKQRTESASEKLQKSKESLKVIEHTANLVIELIDIMNSLILRSEASDVSPLPPILFIDAIFKIIGDSKGSSKDILNLPNLEVIAKAVVYTFAAHCFHRGLRTRLAFAAFLFILTRSSQKYYMQINKIFNLMKDTKKGNTMINEIDEKYEVTFSRIKEKKVGTKLVSAFESLFTYLTTKWDRKTDAYVKNIDHMLSWSDQNHGLASSVFAVIEAVLGTHETNLLVQTEYPHPHLIRKSLLSFSALRPVQCVIANTNNIKDVEIFLNGMLSSFTSNKSLVLHPVSALSNETIDSLRSLMNNGGFSLCPSVYRVQTVLHHCLSLGYSADWIVKHLMTRVESLLGSESRVHDMSGGANQEELKKRLRDKNPSRNRRLKSTAAKLVRGARLGSLMGLSRRGSRISTVPQTGGHSNRKSSIRGSIRGSIRNSFIHLDAKNQDDAIDTLKCSSFRCCITNTTFRNNTSCLTNQISSLKSENVHSAFITLSGLALTEHAIETQYALLTRKRKFSESKIISLAWRTYMHLIHATDLEMRISNHSKKGVHLNNTGILVEVELILSILFRHVLSGNEGNLRIRIFFNIEFVFVAMNLFFQFYCHDEHSINIYKNTFLRQLEMVWDDDKGKVKEEALGSFSQLNNDENSVRIADSLKKTVYEVLEVLLKGSGEFM
jgi:hypothetical protein